MKRCFLVVTLLLALTLVFCLFPFPQAFAWSVFLTDKSDDGTILKFSDGSVFDVVPPDQIDTMLWLPGSDCEIFQRSRIIKGQVRIFYEILNMDDGERILAFRLR